MKRSDGGKVRAKSKADKTSRVLQLSYFCLPRRPRPFLGVDAAAGLSRLAAFWRSSGETDIYRKPDLNRSSVSVK